MRLLKIISVIFGVLFALAGIASVTSGGFVLGLYRLHGAPSGFFTTPSQTVGSNGFALTAPDINGQLAAEWERWILSQAGATIRVTGSSKLPAPLFIGDRADCVGLEVPIRRRPRPDHEHRPERGVGRL